MSNGPEMDRTFTKQPATVPLLPFHARESLAMIACAARLTFDKSKNRRQTWTPEMRLYIPA